MDGWMDDDRWAAADRSWVARLWGNMGRPEELYKAKLRWSLVPPTT